MVDVTAVVPEGRHVIEGYGGGRFQVAGQSYEGSLLIWPEHLESWSVRNLADITMDSLRSVTNPMETSPAEILLIGCGERFTLPPKELLASLTEAGIAAEWMDTGAACRTFNVLIAEERHVAAALIAVD